MENKIIIGKFNSTHGVIGNIKLESYSDPIDKIFSLDLFLDTGEKIKLKPVSLNSRPIICSIVNPKISDKTTAEKFVNSFLYIDKSSLSQIESENEFYVANLVGISVVNKNNETIGQIRAVYNFGASDIIEIEFLDKKVEMYPFNKEFFPVINKNYAMIDL